MTTSVPPLETRSADSKDDFDVKEEAKEDAPPQDPPSGAEDTESQVDWDALVAEIRATSRATMKALKTASKRAIAAAKDLDVIQYGQSTFDTIIKPNVSRLVEACDSDPRIGLVVAAPIFGALIVSGLFLALTVNIVFLLLLGIAAIASTIVVLGAFVALIVKLIAGGLRSPELQSTAQKVAQRGEEASDRIKKSRAGPILQSIRQMAKNRPKLAIATFIIGFKMIMRMFTRRRKPSYETFYNPRRSKWRKVFKVVTAIPFFVFKIVRVIFGMVAHKALHAVAFVIFRFGAFVHAIVSLVFRDFWPILAFALFAYCMILHYRTVKLAKDVDQVRKGKAKDRREAELVAAT